MKSTYFNAQVEVQGCPHPCAYILWLHRALRTCTTKYVPKKSKKLKPVPELSAPPGAPSSAPLSPPLSAPEASVDAGSDTPETTALETPVPETTALETPAKSSSAAPDDATVEADASPSSSVQVKFAFGDKVCGVSGPHAGEVGVIVSQSKVVTSRYVVQWVTAKLGDFDSCDAVLLQVS